jgi:hypothetical protein
MSSFSPRSQSYNYSRNIDDVRGKTKVVFASLFCYDQLQRVAD